MTVCLLTSVKIRKVSIWKKRLSEYKRQYHCTAWLQCIVTTLADKMFSRTIF